MSHPPEEDRAGGLNSLSNELRMNSESILAAKSLFENAPLADYVSGSTVCDLIKAGNMEALEEILPMVDLKQCVMDTIPILHFTVRENQTDILELLLRRGADVSLRDGERRTPLHVAVSNRFLHLARILLKAGCRTDDRDSFGQCALHIAVDNEEFEICKLLLQYNCDVNAENDYGKTALHMAIKHQNTAIVEMLMDAQAVCNIQDNNGQTVAHIAAKSNNLQILKLLSTRVECDFNTKDKLGRTALLWSINNVNIAMLRYLCEMGVNTGTRNYFKETVLFTACSIYCNAEKKSRPFIRDMIILLMEHGAELDCPNTRNVTPIQLFVESGLLEMTQLFLLNGADVNQRDSSGCTLLYNAVKQSNEALVELLLNFSPDINGQRSDRLSNSLLHVAAHNGDDAIVEVLLRNGIDQTIANSEGQTALHHAATRHHASTVQLLLVYGADMNRQDNAGNTALHYIVNKALAFPATPHYRPYCR